MLDIYAADKIRKVINGLMPKKVIIWENGCMPLVDMK